MSTHKISPGKINFETLSNVLVQGQKLALSDDAKKRINKCREYLDKKLAKSKEPIYGINTGFGALYNRSISEKDLEKLQENLVVSHACGTGEEVPQACETTRFSCN